MSHTRAALAIAALLALSAVPGAPAQQRPAAPRMPHALAGKNECATCHASGANPHITSTPAAHTYAPTACAMCHRPPQTPPSAAGHAMDQQHAACGSCHVVGNTTQAPVPPASHSGYHASICRLCHEAPRTPGP